MSEFNQASFLGGMNVLADDTRLQPNQYRYGFNLRNRYDILDEIKNSEVDVSLPKGIIQEVTTFGNYIIAFVSGKAYYRLYNHFGWNKISGYSMSKTAERVWTCQVPVATTNYYRMAGSIELASKAIPDARGTLRQLNVIVGASEGNLPGLVVQDNINQPQFIFVDVAGTLVARTTQNYDQWEVEYDAETQVMTVDKREYVPVGNTMAYVDGKLYVVAQNFFSIYHSVSGHPLDFMVNVDVNGEKGGDATTTSYSVGAGQISCIRGMQDGSLFVSAGNSNFLLVKNTANNAPLLWGEFMYIRKYLFEATCLNDRCIIDSLGDTRFIDLTGVRSFNATLQLENEGRNSPFTAGIQAVFNGIVQDVAAAILFDNYELYAVNTIFGPVIAVYDTISGCWSSFDTSQTGGKKIKQFAKIELGVQRLFAITEDNQLYTLYSAETFAVATLVTAGITASIAGPAESQKISNARMEIKPVDFRCIINKITQNSTVTLTPFVNNRLSGNVESVTKRIKYTAPVTTYDSEPVLPDANTQLTNLYFPLPNCEQGWKCMFMLSWTGGGSVVQFSSLMKDLTPMNPINTQSTTT